MGLTDRLRDLDQKLLPGTREPDEDAETYLRRVAASRAITPAQAGDVMAALRVYFGVEVGPEADDDDGAEDGDGGEQKDEAAESSGNEKDESEGGAEDDESDEKSDDES